MKEISVRGMRVLLSRLEEELRREGGLVLTRRGRPISCIQPLERTAPQPSHADLCERLGRRVSSSASVIRVERYGR